MHTTKPKSYDVEIENHGSLFLFALLTPEAEAWVEANVSSEQTWFGGRLVVEHRYARELAEGMQGAGLSVV